MSSDDEQLTISSHALAALQAFYDEEQSMQERLSKLHSAAEDAFDSRAQDITMDLFKEDWQLSQFWYSESTAEWLADFLIAAQGPSACISAPTAFVAYKQRKSSDKNCTLMEYDARFNVFRDEFVQYDYREPLELSGLAEGSMDTILADPPFLSEECLEKTCTTIKYLASPHARIMICTGAIMKDALLKLLPDMRESAYHPEHKGGLANEFRCFTNFDLFDIGK